MMKDKYEKLNDILSQHNDNEAYVFFFDISNYYSCINLPVYENKLFEVKNNVFSRRQDLNTSIQICYKFLKKYNEEIAERFMNIIRSTDENGPIVRFIPYYNSAQNVVDNNGKVSIYYKNDPSDVRVIIHELFHKINEFKYEVNGNQYIPFANRFFTETVSILAEKLLAEYMLCEGYIDDNDYMILINQRIENSKYAAKLCIIENELLNRNLKGEYIDSMKLNDIRNENFNNTSLSQIWQEEFDNNKIINRILAEGNVNYPKTIEYVVAEYFTEIILRRPDRFDILFELNDIISKTGIEFHEVSGDYLIKKLYR